MAKSSRTPLDQAVASELGLQLGPRRVSVDDVKEKTTQGWGFLFVYKQMGVHFIDLVPVWRDTGGMRFKPERFLMPDSVPERLRQRRYKRWYFGEGVLLHPLNPITIRRLFEEFLFTIDDSVLYRSIPVIDEPYPLSVQLQCHPSQSFQWPDQSLHSKTRTA